jgi:hypothetical protein
MSVVWIDWTSSYVVADAVYRYEARIHIRNRGLWAPGGYVRWVRDVAVTKVLAFFGRNAHQIAILWVYHLIHPPN